MNFNKQFKNIQEEWYKKLKDSGFEDIEQDEIFLKRTTRQLALKSQNQNQSLEDVSRKFELKASYYRLAGQFLHEHKFENTLEKFIWEQHSDGISEREISKKLKEIKQQAGKDKVHRIIAKLKTIMLKKYKEEEND